MIEHLNGITIIFWNVNINSETTYQIVNEALPSLVKVLYFWKFMDFLGNIIMLGLVCYVCIYLIKKAHLFLKKELELKNK